MTDQHPITPPPERFKQWEDDILNERDNVDHVLDCAWKDGFRAGADQELEACCAWLEREVNGGWELANQLRTARRPKPPSLAEEASKALDRVPGPGVDLAYLQNWANREAGELLRVTRAALERLQELENNG